MIALAYFDSASHGASLYLAIGVCAIAGFLIAAFGGAALLPLLRRAT